MLKSHICYHKLLQQMKPTRLKLLVNTRDKYKAFIKHQRSFQLNETGLVRKHPQYVCVKRKRLLPHKGQRS